MQKADIKTIIILGTGASVRYCDFKADEIWGVNGAYFVVNLMPAKYQRHFKMNKLFLADYLFSPEGKLNFHIPSLREFADKYGCQIISMHRLQLGKYKLGASLYPYKSIVSKFGSNYFTDTITYMIAYALHKHTVLAQNSAGVIRPELMEPLCIRLFGVDMSTTTEYKASKGGVEFWLGMARALGCEAEISRESVILANPHGATYGFRKKIDRKLVDPYGSLENPDARTDYEPTIRK